VDPDDISRFILVPENQGLRGTQHLGSGVPACLRELLDGSHPSRIKRGLRCRWTSFVANPATLLTLSNLKVAADWNQPLLGVAPSSPTKRSIQGVPVQWSPAVDEDVIWGIPQAKVFVVLRLPASIVTDRSAYFSSDGVLLQ
jgi:hypothetical protein